MSTPELPTRYRRKYPLDSEVLPQDLRAAYEVAAQLVVDHGDQYMPIFERLDTEIQRRHEQDAVRQRAVVIARQKAVRRDP